MRVSVRLPHLLAPGLPRMVTASAAAHLLLGLAVVTVPALWPRGLRPPPFPVGDVMSGLILDSVPGGGPALGPPPEPSAPPPAAAPEPEPPPPPQVPPPPPPEPRAEKRPKQPEPPKPKPKPRAATTDAGPSTARPGAGAEGAPGGTGSTGSASGGGNGPGIGLSIGGGSFGHGYYVGLVKNKLQANFAAPLHPGDGGPLSVRVVFRIERLGQVSDVSVEIPSPYPALDSAALRAVYRAAPMPPLPPQFAGDSVDVAVTFTLEPVGV